MNNELQDALERLRRASEDRLLEKLRTDVVEKDLVHANYKLRLPRYWIGRLYTVFPTLVVMAIIRFEPESLGHRMLLGLEPSGWIVLYIISALAMLGVADVIVNDIMPARFVLPFAARWRHLGYMGLSVSLACLMFLVTAIHGNSALNLIFGTYMAMAAFVGISAPFSRHCWRN